MRLSRVLVALVVTPTALYAQSAAPAAVNTPPLPDVQQIAAAVLPLPAEFREHARVFGYHAGSNKLVVLRQGSGPFNCLATDPAANSFHVACYHASMEPFMLRGRELRAAGVKGDQVDTVRFAEVRAGKLAMPKSPAALYTLTGKLGSYDAATNVATGAQSLYVVYIPGATAASTGITDKPAPDAPWIMYPGTPKAHIMFVPKM